MVVFETAFGATIETLPDTRVAVRRGRFVDIARDCNDDQIAIHDPGREVHRVTGGKADATGTGAIVIEYRYFGVCHSSQKNERECQREYKFTHCDNSNRITAEELHHRTCRCRGKYAEILASFERVSSGG